MGKEKADLPDIVIPVKHGVKNYDELRYCLRSLENYKHNSVFLAGYIPRWATNVVACPKPQKTHPRVDVLHNLLTAIEHPDLKENIVVLNDDFFILQPVDVMPIFHGRNVGLAVWKGASLQTANVMKKLGCWSGKSYEQHLPFVCEKSKLKYVLEKIVEFEPKEYGRVLWRTVYGNYYHIGGELTIDVKVRRNPVILPGQKFISSEETTFGSGLKKLLEPRFPNKSIYEK